MNIQNPISLNDNRTQTLMQLVAKGSRILIPGDEWSNE